MRAFILHRQVVWTIVIAMIVGCALTVTSAVARASDFGELYLVQGQCCSGAALWGSRATITSNSWFAVPSTECGLARMDAEGGTDYATEDNRLIQVGIARCGTNVDIDDTCSLTNNLIYYMEVLWSVGSNPSYHCTPIGQAVQGDEEEFSVWRNTGAQQIWHGYFDSNQVTGTYDYVTIPYTWGIFASGELTDCFTGSGCGTSGFNVKAAYDGPNQPCCFASLAWQRYDPSSDSWVTIQAANACNGPSDLLTDCTGGGWSIVDSPPGEFDTNYPG